MAKYSFYVDDSGASKPGTRDEFDYFALGGILLKQTDEKAAKKAVDKFKRRWNIPEDVPLRGTDIRGRTKKFAWLGRLSDAKQAEFQLSLVTLLTELPLVAHACVIHRRRYARAFNAKYGRNVWSMRRSATSMLLERAVKFVRAQQGTHLDVYFENTGGVEDTTFREEYEKFLTYAHPFDAVNASKYMPLTVEEISDVLAKKPVMLNKQSKLLQLADLCLYPLTVAKDGSNDIYAALVRTSRVIDALVSNAEKEGVKYYCFPA